LNAAAPPLQVFELAGRVDFLALHRRHPQRYPFLLESAASHALAGRYDLLFAFPQVALEVSRDDADCSVFFDDLNRAFAHEKLAAIDDLPFCGGWFLLLGYEAARGAEPRLKLPPSPYVLPDALAVRCPAAAIYDRKRDRTILIAEHDAAQLQTMRNDCAEVLPAIEMCTASLLEHIDQEPAENFLAGVEKILEYLAAGDAFQVNLSRRWHGRLRDDFDYIDLYANLRHANPAPFAGLARWGDAAVLSSSPERLLAIENGIAQTRPIAGTHARLVDAAQDKLQREHLIASLKERAEHIMLIDLERSDLGRVCVPGSVLVSELMSIESYAHVHHIVSNVSGRLRADVGPGDALRAVFPGGTITGCPKVRSMQIIAQLESGGRGPYTGAMGYLSRCGRLDTNILIRTLVCEGADVSFRAGAGIVADSDPQSELAETRAKARGLLRAMGAAS
jgi:anthranilate synthase component 1